MKYLFIGSDRKSFEPDSNVSGRYVAFAKFADRIDAVVPTWRSLKLPKSREITPNVHIYGTNGFTKIGGFLRTIFLLTKLAKRNKPDLIIARDPFEYGIVALIASKLSGIPFVAQMHTDISSSWFASTSFGNRMRTWVAPFVVSRAKSLRVISQSLAENTKKLNLLDPKKIVVVPPMYSDVWKGIGEASSEDRKKNRILMVSRLEYEKDIPTAFRAFKYAVDAVPDKNLELVILGSGSAKKELEDYATELGIRNLVKFEGWIEAPWKLFQSAQVFLQPSFYEGFGMSIVEAYAHGCFCVATDAGIARELVTSDRDGTVCAVRDDVCLGKGIVNALPQVEISNDEKIMRKEKIKKIIPYQTFDEYAEAFMGYLESIAKKA